MSCCGGQRRAFRHREYIPPAAPVTFEYIGKTSAVVIGAVTGKHYSFTCQGASLEVDARDVPSLQAVPVLRQTRQDRA